MILQKKEFKVHVDDTDQYQSLIAEEAYYKLKKVQPMLKSIYGLFTGFSVFIVHH
jgi:hypothetical protein